MLRLGMQRYLAALLSIVALLVLPASFSQEHTALARSMTLRSVVTHSSAGPTAQSKPPTPPAPAPARPSRIALTFDSNMTDWMLQQLATGRVKSYADGRVIDELQRSHAPATFFLSGEWVQRYPDLTRRIAADPNFELASHSYSHLGFAPHCYNLGLLPFGQMAADVEHSFQVLAPFGGRQTRYFRFPGGCYNAQALQAIAPAHCTVVEYDIVGDDAFNNNTNSIVNSVLGSAHDGGIVVLHITEGNAPHTADALPAIITGLRARGYELVRVSQLLSPHPK